MVSRTANVGALIHFILSGILIGRDIFHNVLPERGWVKPEELIIWG